MLVFPEAIVLTTKLRNDAIRSLCNKARLAGKVVARALIGGWGAYSYIHVVPDEFLFKSNSNSSI